MLDFTYIYILTATALIVLLTIIRRSNHLDERKNQFIIFAIFSDIVILLGYVGRDLSEQFSNMPLAHISNTLIYLFAPLSMFFLILASTKKRSNITIILTVLESISAFIALSSPFTGWFYTISHDVIYSRGPLYFYNEILGILFTILWAVYSFIEFRYIEPIDKFYLSEIFILQTASIIIQGLYSSYKIIYICGAFSIMIYYAFVTEVYGKYDRMTGIRNNSYYRSVIMRNLYTENFSVIMADANGLKGINDSYGHDVGDKFILIVTSAIVKAVGKNGSVYRTGGDEFVIVIKSKDRSLVNRIDEDIHKNLSEENKNYEFEISASTGIAVHSEIELFTDTVKRADKKMYENKNEYYARTGKDRRTYQRRAEE